MTDIENDELLSETINLYKESGENVAKSLKNNIVMSSDIKKRFLLITFGEDNCNYYTTEGILSSALYFYHEANKVEDPRNKEIILSFLSSILAGNETKYKQEMSFHKSNLFENNGFVPNIHKFFKSSTTCTSFDGSVEKVETIIEKLLFDNGIMKFSGSNIDGNYYYDSGMAILDVANTELTDKDVLEKVGENFKKQFEKDLFGILPDIWPKEQIKSNIDRILSKIKFMLINGGDIFMTAKDNTNVIPFIGSGNDWKITKLLEGLRRSTINEETMMKK
jgi:hypothetical protein